MRGVAISLVSALKILSVSLVGLIAFPLRTLGGQILLAVSFPDVLQGLVTRPCQRFPAAGQVETEGSEQRQEKPVSDSPSWCARGRVVVNGA